MQTDNSTMNSRSVSFDSPEALARLKKRRGKESRFRLYGRLAIGFALAALIWLMGSIITTGYSAFGQHFIRLDFALSESLIDKNNIRGGNYRKIVQDAIYAEFPDATSRNDKRKLFALVSSSGATNQLRQMVYKNPEFIGQIVTVTVPTSDHVDQLLKGKIDRNLPETRRQFTTDQQIRWADDLKARGIIKLKFNRILFTNPDSRDPELAGVASAIAGSVMVLLVAFLMAFPIGVGSAIYLDEFAPKNRWTDFIEININNLAAVPSIVFGLLGLAVFLTGIHLNLPLFGDTTIGGGFPRSAALVGGMVLALRVFPTITIATRSALQGVSPSMVDGALSLGASHTQAVFQQKLPLAGPGILTGSIIAMAQALGETAPLLMIGMVAFVTEIPNSIAEPATALPVQIFLWSDSAERAWAERTSAAIIILLVVLIVMNGFAIWLRGRLEKRR